MYIANKELVPGIYGSKQLLFTVNTSVHVQVFTVTVYKKLYYGAIVQ